MRLHEVLATGLDYRRASWPEDMGWNAPGKNSYSYDDVLATDWEVKEPAVTHTKRAFVEPPRCHKCGQTYTNFSSCCSTALGGS